MDMILHAYLSHVWILRYKRSPVIMSCSTIVKLGKDGVERVPEFSIAYTSYMKISNKGKINAYSVIYVNTDMHVNQLSLIKFLNGISIITGIF